MTDIRKEFEAWYASKWDFEHPDFAMQTMWFAYQAAYQHQQQRIDALEKELVAMTAELKAARKANDKLQQALRGEG